MIISTFDDTPFDKVKRSRPLGAIPSESVFGSEIRAGRDSSRRFAAFAEIRRALPSSYRESRKAVSTVVFGPAVSLERSTPLMRPRHDSHAENKNISPRAPQSFSLRRAEILRRGPAHGPCICLRVCRVKRREGKPGIRYFIVFCCTRGSSWHCPRSLCCRVVKIRVCNNARVTAKQCA